jgi:hypothetical protein
MHTCTLFGFGAQIYLKEYTADCGGYTLSTYALAICVHIYNSLINVGCLHILLHI